MARLAGIDAAFLYLETPSAHMHIVGTMVVDPSTAPDQTPKAIERIITARLAAIPRLRRRVVEVPLGLEHPEWADDPRFRAQRHVRRRRLRAPGSEEQLAALIGTIASRPLARDRPLWELWSIRGLAGGRLALVVKVHHATMDGVSGTELLAQMLDLQPCPPRPTRRPRPSGAPLPSAVELVRSALASWTERPRRFARAVGDTGRFAYRALAGATVGAGPTLPFTAPRTFLNDPISADRSVAFGRVAIADVKAIKRRLGLTVNDVVLGGCTMALRRYLEQRGAVPDRPLVASVPVAVTHADQLDTVNRVSAMFVGLPVHIADGLGQLRAVAEDTVRAKGLQRAVGPALLQEWAQLLPPGLFTQSARLFWRFRLAELVRPIHNLVVSNVPGPQFPMYAAGARVVEVYPLGPVLEGAGMNITVLSYDDTVHFGVITCRRAVPDPWPIARGFEEAIRSLARVIAAPRVRRRRAPVPPPLVPSPAVVNPDAASYSGRSPEV